MIMMMLLFPLSFVIRDTALLDMTESVNYVINNEAFELKTIYKSRIIFLKIMWVINKVILIDFVYKRQILDLF